MLLYFAAELYGTGILAESGTYDHGRSVVIAQRRRPCRTTVDPVKVQVVIPVESSLRKGLYPVGACIPVRLGIRVRDAAAAEIGRNKVPPLGIFFGIHQSLAAGYPGHTQGTFEAGSKDTGFFVRRLCADQNDAVRTPGTVYRSG